MTSAGFRGPRAGTNLVGNQGQQRNREQERLQQQLRRSVNGIDIVAQTQALGVNGYQGPLPELDLRPIGKAVADDQGRVAQAMALTIRSRRGGLNMQRDFVEAAHTRQASSTARSDFRDEAFLNFETTLQHDVSSIYSQFRPTVLHNVYQGRSVMARLGTLTASTSGLFVETSLTDPTIKEVAFPAFTVGVSGLVCMNVIKYNAGDYLCLSGYIGVSPYFVLIGNLDNPSSGAIYIPAVRELSDLGFPLSTSPYNVGAFMQVGTEGNPLIVKSGGTFIVQPTIASADWPGLTWAPGTLTQGSWIGGNNFPLRTMSVSGRKPKSYFVHSVDGYSLILNCVDVNGFNYEEPELSISPLRGAVAISGRGAIALTNGERVVLWDGREKETGAFSDEPLPLGQMLYCMGVRHDNGQLFASIMELPSPDDPIPFADAGGYSIGYGRIRIQERKYDFDLQRWFAVSDWTTLTENGLIRWDLYPGHPIPAVSDAQGHYGYVTLWGSPDLPGLSGSRHIYNYIQSAFKTSSPSTPDPNVPATWIRKFEPVPGVNPYSYNGKKAFAETALDRSPGLLFGGDALYADKIIDAVWFAGVDSGGDGSLWRLWIAEYGHLDDVDSEGNRTAMYFEFKHGGKHQDRYVPARNNFSPMMVPQFEMELVRGSDENLTPQYLPFTVYFHVVLPQQEPIQPTDTGRAPI